MAAKFTVLEYKGDLVAGQRQGNGEATLEQGYKYCGQWSNNLAHGYGVLTGPETEYRGQWQKGLHHGCGTLYEKGNTFSGEWSQNKLNGFATVTMPTGDKIIGTFKDGKQDGVKLTILSSGQVKVCNHIGNECSGVTIMYSNDGTAEQIYEATFGNKTIKTIGSKAIIFTEKRKNEVVSYDAVVSGKISYQNGNNQVIWPIVQDKFNGKDRTLVSVKDGQVKTSRAEQASTDWATDSLVQNIYTTLNCQNSSTTTNNHFTIWRNFTKGYAQMIDATATRDNNNNVPAARKNAAAVKQGELMERMALVEAQLAILLKGTGNQAKIGAVEAVPVLALGKSAVEEANSALPDAKTAVQTNPAPVQTNSAPVEVNSMMQLSYSKQKAFVKMFTPTTNYFNFLDQPDRSKAVVPLQLCNENNFFRNDKGKNLILMVTVNTNGIPVLHQPFAIESWVHWLNGDFELPTLDSEKVDNARAEIVEFYRKATAAPANSGSSVSLANNEPKSIGNQSDEKIQENLVNAANLAGTTNLVPATVNFWHDVVITATMTKNWLVTFSVRHKGSDETGLYFYFPLHNNVLMHHSETIKLYPRAYYSSITFYGVVIMNNGKYSEQKYKLTCNGFAQPVKVSLPPCKQEKIMLRQEKVLQLIATRKENRGIKRKSE